MTRRLALAVVLLLALAPLASAQNVVFVVRHAERADAGMNQGAHSTSLRGSEDPPLSAEGEARAKRLAQMLRSADVKHVFASEFKRTEQTARPLAAAEHLEITTVPAKNIEALVQKLSGLEGASLVVGHSNTVPDILRALGVKKNVNVSDDEYDNLFIVVRSAGGAKLITLRF